MDNKQLFAGRFAALFAAALDESISSAIGEPWPVEIPAYSEFAGNYGTPLHFRLHLDGAIRGECFAELYDQQITHLLAKMGHSTDQMSPEDRAEAIAKLVSNALPGLSKSIAGAFGATTIKLERAAGLAFGGMFLVTLAATSDPSHSPVLLYLSTALLDSLVQAGALGTGAVRKEVNPANLNLLMDVELNVSLLFGRSKLPLRDVIDLTSGSVVELDRLVDEPVELLLDGKVIARGEAVVVDGNYGLRVTEIPGVAVNHILNAR